MLKKFLVMAEASEEDLSDLYKDEIEAIQKSSKKSPTSGLIIHYNLNHVIFLMLSLLKDVQEIKITIYRIIFYYFFFYAGKKKKKSPAKSNFESTGLSTPLQNSFYSSVTPFNNNNHATNAISVYLYLNLLKYFNFFEFRY